MRDVAPTDKEMIEFMVITFRLSSEIGSLSDLSKERVFLDLQNRKSSDRIADSN